MTDIRVPARATARRGEVRIVLVDDHAIMRQGLRSVLEREPQFAIVGEASSAPEALAVVAHQRPTIVLLDLKLSTSSDSEGLQLCRQLTQAHPGRRRARADDVPRRPARRRGRARRRPRLRRQGRRHHRADRAPSAPCPAASRRSTPAPPPPSCARSTASSPTATRSPSRELDVLRLLARGMSNRTIGRELFISETTVKFHVGNLMRKLDVTRRAEAVYAASKMGLI